uniref:Uncharacterized protein n=1 Tax=Panagrolaimus sp. ES5 TaxID=591445 RepID=A0AC34FGR6_9BILA
MRNLILVVLAFATLAVATVPEFWIDNLIELTPPEHLPKLMGSKLALGETCPNEQVILKANADWLAYLNITGYTTWKNATQIWPRIKNMFVTDDVNVLQTVCRSRDLFYLTLGQENYYHCISIYGLMQYTQDWKTAAYYVRMWSHLDFMCNIGYQQFMNKSAWTCLVYLNQNQGCNDAYVANNGYFACEDVRLGYGGNCDIRCTV